MSGLITVAALRARTRASLQVGMTIEEAVGRLSLDATRIGLSRAEVDRILDDLRAEGHFTVRETSR